MHSNIFNFAVRPPGPCKYTESQRERERERERECDRILFKYQNLHPSGHNFMHTNCCSVPDNLSSNYNGDTIIVSLKRLFYCIFLNEIHYNLLSGFPELTVPNSVIKQKSKISYIRGQSNEPRMYFYPDNDASYGELHRGVTLTIISICFSSYKK